MLAQNDANTANWAHDTKIKQHGVTGMHARGTIEKPAFYTASLGCNEASLIYLYTEPAEKSDGGACVCFMAGR
jgi:hypothetical protein